MTIMAIKPAYGSFGSETSCKFLQEKLNQHLHKAGQKKHEVKRLVDNCADFRLKETVQFFYLKLF